MQIDLTLICCLPFLFYLLYFLKNYSRCYFLYSGIIRMHSLLTEKRLEQMMEERQKRHRLLNACFYFWCKQCHGNSMLRCRIGDVLHVCTFLRDGATPVSIYTLCDINFPSFSSQVADAGSGRIAISPWHFAAPFVEWPKSQVRKL